jgi:hypothetical protein
LVEHYINLKHLGDPRFIGHSTPTQDYASFIIFDFFKNHPEYIKELVSKIKKEHKTNELVFSRTYGYIHKKENDYILVGYYEIDVVPGAVSMSLKDDSYTFALKEGKDMVYVNVYHYKKGEVGRITGFIRDNSISISGSIEKKDGTIDKNLTQLAFEELIDYANRKGLKISRSRGGMNDEEWNLYKKFFDRI